MTDYKASKRIVGTSAERPITGVSLGSTANGTVTGATLDTSNEKLGSGCYSFDGSNDKIQTGDCSALNGATAFSISLWKNNSSTPSKSEAFINIGSDNTTNQFRMIVGGNYTTIEMWLNAVESSSKISVDCDGNGWIHYVVVWDSTQTGDSNKFKLYKNGSAQTLSFQGSNNAGDSAIQTISGGTPIIIGSLASAGVEYTGLIDDVGIFNRALSSDEVDDLYNGGTGAVVTSLSNTNGLLAYYPFDANANNLSNDDGVNVLQTNSIFEESDTGKHYIWSGSAWTEVA